MSGRNIGGHWAEEPRSQGAKETRRESQATGENWGMRLALRGTPSGNCWSMSMCAPLLCCRLRIVSPPLPMILPMRPCRETEFKKIVYALFVSSFGKRCSSRSGGYYSTLQVMLRGSLREGGEEGERA